MAKSVLNHEVPKQRMWKCVREQVLSNMGLRHEEPTLVNKDNLVAIPIAHCAGIHQRSQHFTRQLIKDGIMEVFHKQTDKMLAVVNHELTSNTISIFL